MSAKHPAPDGPLSAAAARAEHWRSLEELAGLEALEEAAHDEFLPGVVGGDGLTRRRFLTLMGAGAALAGLTGCGGKPPREKILPFVRRPEEVVPGRPLYYATAMTLGGYATGLLVESHEGRPVKAEGNPAQRSSLGATDAVGQASILGLYDPERSRNVTYLGRPSTGEAALEALSGAVARLREGEGLHVLTETVTSPTLGRLLIELEKAYPKMRWHQYEPVNRDEVLAGVRLAFDADVQTVHRYHRADVIVSLDADFLTEGPERLPAAVGFAYRRRGWWDGERQSLNRLYVVEAGISITGAKADHRLPMQARRIEAFTRALAARLAESLRDQQEADAAAVALLAEQSKKATGLTDAQQRWAAAVARDLTANGRRGKTLLVAGQHQPAAVHALCHAMNRALDNVNGTVEYVEPVEGRPVIQGESLRQLVRDMNADKVQALLILGGNPVYNAPGDLDFTAALNRVPLRFHLGLHDDETARLCHWHLPEAHFLEAWGDARGHDGRATVQQPLIAPLYEGARTAMEFLVSLTDEPARSAHDLVRAHWRDVWDKRNTGGDFEAFWNAALHEGVVPDTASRKAEPRLRREWPADAAGGETSQERLEIVFRPDPFLHDGRFASNGWLQELPRPMTRVCWDNVALVSPATAEKLSIRSGRSGVAPDLHAPQTEVVRLHLGNGRELEAPVWIMPGHPDDSVTVHLGHGRTRAGKLGTGVGFNAFSLRTSSAPWFEGGLVVERTGKRTNVASVQHHHLMENRDLVRGGTVQPDGTPKLNPLLHPHPEEHPPGDEGHGEHGSKGRVALGLYPAWEYPGHKWGMAIDLTACVGCAACVVACQAENNIPTVGRDQVLNGREMHWIRIDRYYAGEPKAPRVHFQPVPCMHCETAPCEPVCPVAATVHSDEGLNDMVYNRCVGTRYCSNNCPYKVRRFNFLTYNDWTSETLRLSRNPDVTVRSRGVMEKCSYCVQRINAARIDAEKRAVTIGRYVLDDGAVQTSCQAACPTSAIVFGDVNHKGSKVARAKASPLNYGLLEDLNTFPRTTYLGELRNTNDDPELRD